MTDHDTETAAGFLAARADWLRVEAVDRPGGGFDVVLRIDGTYSGAPDLVDRNGMVAYFAEWLANVLNREGIAVLRQPASANPPSATLSQDQGTPRGGGRTRPRTRRGNQRGRRR